MTASWKKIQELSSDDDDNDKMKDSFEDIIKGPLRKKFYLALIELEHQISGKLFYSMQQVLDLVGMYGRCVEYFDSACDPVRWYFIEKISSTLAESKTHEMILANEQKIIEEGKKQKQIKYIQKESNIKIDPLSRSKQNNQTKDKTNLSQLYNKPINLIDKQKNQNFDISQIKLNITDDDEGIESLSAQDIKQIINFERDVEKKVSLKQHRETRTKKLNLQEEVMKERILAKQDEIIDNLGEQMNKTDNFVKQELDSQQNQINYRLQKRNQNKSNTIKQHKSEASFYNVEKINPKQYSEAKLQNDNEGQPEQILVQEFLC